MIRIFPYMFITTKYFNFVNIISIQTEDEVNNQSNRTIENTCLDFILCLNEKKMNKQSNSGKITENTTSEDYKKKKRTKTRINLKS